MEFEQNLKFDQEDNLEKNNFNIRDIIDKYLAHWKWFLLSVVISFIIAIIMLNFTRPQYSALATIQINDDSGADNSKLSAFQDLGILSTSKDKIDDEIVILNSKSLITEVVKSLKLNVNYFTEKGGLSKFLDNNLGFSTDFFKKEEYYDPPLKINFLLNDSLLYNTNAQFIITVNSSTHYTFRDIEGLFEKRYAFGEKISTFFGDIILTPNLDLEKHRVIGTDILVNISALEDLVNSYTERIKIEPTSEFSSIVSLKISDGSKKKAEYFLNELVKQYNDRAINLKEETTINTSNFVNKRLEIISNELLDVDLSAESIKTKYRISDVASETGLNMQSGQAVENQIVEANTQLAKIGYIKEFVAKKSNNDLIPVDVGVADNNVSTAMQKYNELMMEKKRLLKNSTDKNPIVVNINDQLKALNDNINQGLNNLESSQQISLDALNRLDARIDSRLYAAPKQERQYRDIQRQQQIKESLYLYLLQKREETAITLGVADPNAKIIDYASSYPDPISPNNLIYYLVAGFIGLLVPFGTIYSIDILNSKIHKREDVEKELNIPIIGDIPKLESKDRYLIKKDDYSSIAEAFRILRTNLNFVLPDSKKNNGKIIFITSTIASEGKSLVSSNLATAFAHAGKRTVLLGMDIRAPKIHTYLGVKGKQGITNYIINSDLRPKDICIDVPNIDNLQLIPSGDIAPNPAELLMNQRVTELFNYCKENYEYVIVDTAAFSMVTDTLLLSRFSDAVIYVIRANFLDKRALKYIKSLYKERRLPNMTLLINGIDHKKNYGYGYGYGYGTKFEKNYKKTWWKK